MNKLALFFLGTTFLAFSNAEAVFNSGLIPSSYKLMLVRNYIEMNSLSRELHLHINDKPVGYVTYRVSKDNNYPSYINLLHVDQNARSKNGYGKALLYHALKDIANAGSTRVELSRCPYDLKATDNFAIRDNQLKKFYGDFGFTDKPGCGSSMLLLNPKYFMKANVEPDWTDSGDIKFKLLRK